MAGVYTRRSRRGDALRRRHADWPRRRQLVTVHTDWEVLNVGDHVSAASTTLEGLRALDDAGARSSLVWLHYFDVHEHHQIDVPRSLLAHVHPGARRSSTSTARCSARSTTRSAVFSTSSRHATSTITRSSCSSAITARRSPRIRACSTRTARSRTRPARAHACSRLHVPGVAPGQRTDLVSLVDLAPTLLDLIGAPTAMQPLDGIDLVPALLDVPIGRPPTRPRDRDPRGAAVVASSSGRISCSSSPPTTSSSSTISSAIRPSTPISRRAGRIVVTRSRARYAGFPDVRVDRTPSGRSFPRTASATAAEPCAAMSRSGDSHAV